MKYAGKMNLSTFTKMFSIFPSKYAIDLSASCNITVVGHASPIPSCLKIEKGIKLMLAPRPRKALPTYHPPMEHEILKLSGSFNL